MNFSKTILLIVGEHKIFLTHFKKIRDARDQGHDILDKFDKKCLPQKGSKVTHNKIF